MKKIQFVSGNAYNYSEIAQIFKQERKFDPSICSRSKLMLQTAKAIMEKDPEAIGFLYDDFEGITIFANGLETTIEMEYGIISVNSKERKAE